MLFTDRWPEREWPQTVAGVLVMVLIVGAGGYKLLTTATPVTRESALERFRAEISERGDGSGDKRARGATQRGTVHSDRSRSEARSNDDRGSVASSGGDAAESEEVVAAAPAEQNSSSGRSKSEPARPEAGFTPGRPEEGVYSWATEGYESFNGSRRQFPSETQRIVTHEGADGYVNHHYFSEERQSWSGVVVDERGYLISWQRNKIVFGPVTRDQTIRFDPPLRVGLYPAQVGDSWEGSWDGPTYGDYSMRVFDHTTMTIGGTEVEVWALEMHMTLHGETEGRVLGRFWVNTERHLVVREYYRQDVESGPGSYRAEWDQTLKSLEPRR
ncbi:MAG: hypothetical protein ACRDKT_12935 [Actinomycetota bacterium]